MVGQVRKASRKELEGLGGDVGKACHGQSRVPAGNKRCSGFKKCPCMPVHLPAHPWHVPIHNQPIHVPFSLRMSQMTTHCLHTMSHAGQTDPSNQKKEQNKLHVKNVEWQRHRFCLLHTQ